MRATYLLLPLTAALTPDFSFYPPHAIPCLNSSSLLAHCSGRNTTQLNACLCSNTANWIPLAASCLGRDDPSDVVRVWSVMQAACADSNTPMDLSQSEFYAAADGVLASSTSSSSSPSTTATSTATPTERAERKSGSVSTGATVGIAVGASIGGVAVVAALVAFLVRLGRNARWREEDAAQEGKWESPEGSPREEEFAYRDGAVELPPEQIFELDGTGSRH